MIVTISCDVLGEENNGTTIAAFNLYRHLKANGHEVRVICPDECRIGQKDFYVLPQLSLGVLDGYVKRNGVCLAKPEDDVIRAALTGADIVHVMTPFAVGKATVRIAEELGIPVSAGFHAQAENFSSHIFMKDVKWVNNIIYKVFNKTLFSHARCIHYPTQFIRDLFESVVGPTNGYVISNGVNDAYIKKTVVRPEKFNGKTIILFTGRYSKEKSHRVLIDAVAQSRYAKDIQLIFAGSGPLEEKLKKQSEKLPNAPIFKFFSRAELIDVLNYADLYVHPAEIEIEAIACTEAICCGLVPIIANSPRCATKAFALDEKNLFENLNSADLAAKIDYWISNPELKAQRAAQYAQFCCRFSQTACMQDMEQMLMLNAKESYEGENLLLHRPV